MNLSHLLIIYLKIKKIKNNFLFKFKHGDWRLGKIIFLKAEKF